MIDQYRDRLPIRDLCEIAGVSRSAYHDWSSKLLVVDEKPGLELEKEIEEIVEEFPGYGYRRVTREIGRLKPSR